jgi:hypothetical protein
VEYLDAQQNLDVVRLVVVHLDAMHLLDVVVGVELRHQLKMDCYQDVVDVEVRHLMKMDCYLDVVQQVLLELEELQALLVLNLHEQLRLVLRLGQLRHLRPLLRVMLSTLQDRHRALLQVQQRVLDLHRPSLKRQLSWRQLSLQASSLQLASHRERVQSACEQRVAQLLMMQIGRIRPSLVIWQGLPCFPYRVVLLTHVRGPLTHFSCLGPHVNL